MEKKEKSVESWRKDKVLSISQLSDFLNAYDADKFIADLQRYFDDSVDFNLLKIRQTIELPGKLLSLRAKALEKNTHPVTEFLQELFLEIGQSGDVEWSGEW